MGWNDLSIPKLQRCTIEVWEWISNFIHIWYHFRLYRRVSLYAEFISPVMDSFVYHWYFPSWEALWSFHAKFYLIQTWLSFCMCQMGNAATAYERFLCDGNESMIDKYMNRFLLVHGTHSTKDFSANLMEIAQSHLNFIEVMATKFCTWHDSSAVMSCAKICCTGQPGTELK